MKTGCAPVADVFYAGEFNNCGLFLHYHLGRRNEAYGASHLSWFRLGYS